MKKYVLIAGVNGAGKSTLYQLLDSISDLPMAEQASEAFLIKKGCITHWNRKKGRING